MIGLTMLITMLITSELNPILHCNRVLSKYTCKIDLRSSCSFCTADDMHDSYYRTVATRSVAMVLTIIVSKL